MRLLHRGPIFALFAGALGLGATPVAYAGARWFPSTWGDVFVSTDATPAGRKLTPPTKEQPVYYKGMSLGRHLGSIRGDVEPPVQELNRFVADILAKEGYLAARPGVHEPALLLVLQWGYLTPGVDDLYWFLGYDEKRDVAARTQIDFIGAEAFRTNFRSREIEMILQDAQHPIYGIIITAFEHESARTTKPIVYWQTRIGLPTNGKSMAMALPVMLVAAGPVIGRPSEGPVLLDTDSARKGRVNLGELKFINSFEVLGEGRIPAKPAGEKK